MPDNNKKNRLHAAGAISLFVLMSGAMQTGFAQVGSIGLAGNAHGYREHAACHSNQSCLCRSMRRQTVYTGLFRAQYRAMGRSQSMRRRTSANKDPAWRNSALCLFKYPLPVGKPLGDVIFRVYNVDSSCRYQAAYKDYHPATNVPADPTYDDVRSSMVTMHIATSALAHRSQRRHHLRVLHVCAGRMPDCSRERWKMRCMLISVAAFQTVLFGERFDFHTVPAFKVSGIRPRPERRAAHRTQGIFS
jgi:hypothetical protein